MIEHANEDLRQNLKTITEQVKADPELALGLSGERRAYVNATAVESFFQEAVEQTGADMDDVVSGLMEPLGVSRDAFFEALDNGTDVLIDLTALPEVVNNPLWDQIIDLATVEPLAVTREMEADLAEMAANPPVILGRADADVTTETKTDLERRLTAAGRSKADTKRDAIMLSRMAGRLASYTGADPNALIRNVIFGRAGVDGQLAAGQGGLNQGRISQAISSLFQRVWNGAAERFEQFKEEFIGSGIGERLYGWGFYFSDNRHNADGYRRRLSGNSQTIYNGKPYFQMNNGWKYFDEDNSFKKMPYDSALRQALDVFERYGKTDGKLNLQDKLKSFQKELGAVLTGRAPQTRKTVIGYEGRMDEILFDEARLRKEIETAKEAMKIISRLKTAKGGALYQADIPENDVLLDYDAGLAEQPESVRTSLETLVEERGLGDMLTRPEDGEAPDGLTIYRRLARELGAEREASLLLNEYGVKGARYAARASHDRGANAQNFVVYDAGSIEILESFYQSAINDQNQAENEEVFSEPEGAKETPSRAWPRGFPNVTPLTTVGRMKAHPDYQAAKGGDREAAARLILDIMAGKAQQEKLRQLAEAYPDAIVVPVHAEEQSGRNRIPGKFADYIGKAAGLEVNTDIIQAGRVGRTGSDAWHRLAFRPKFDGEVQKGRQYILVDDVTTGGGTFSELRRYIEMNGGQVVHMASLGTAQFSANIALSEKTRLALEAQYGVESLQSFLKETGLYGGNHQALTESEARTILAARTLDQARNRILATRQKGLSQTQPGSLQGREAAGEAVNSPAPAGASPDAPGQKSPKSLYQDQNEFRGRTDFLPGNIARVVFSPKADSSTAMHEFQHIFIRMAKGILALPDDQIIDKAARDQLRTDIEALGQWAGLKPGEEWTTEAHEKVAKAFEAYLMEGKAPVKELRGLFSRMKKLLLDIYKTLKNLNVELTDDVRRVFDRQLATEEELALESWREEPVFNLDDMQKEVDPQLWAEYTAAREKARQKAREDLVKFRNAEHKKLVAKWRREGQAEARQDPRQRHLADIVNGGGIRRNSLEAGGYDAEAIAMLAKKRVGLITAKNDKGQGYDEWAKTFGYDDNSDDFIQDIINTPTIDELTEAYVAEQESLFADYFDAELGISEAEIDVYEMERNMMLAFLGRKPPKPGSWRDIKARIDQKNGLKTVEELLSQSGEELKAGLKAIIRAARDYYKEGLEKGLETGKKKGYKEGAQSAGQAGFDLGTAQERDRAAKQRVKLMAQERARAMEQRLNLAARLRSATEHKIEVLKTEAEWRKIVGQKAALPYKYGGIEPEYHAQIKNLLARAGMGQPVQARSGLGEFIQQLEADGAPVAVADWLMAAEWPRRQGGKRAGSLKTWRGLSYDQFIDLKNAVKNLTLLGRTQQQVRVDGRLRNETEAVRELIVGLPKWFIKRDKGLWIVSVTP
ncbi:MAG: hypothetical protein LBS31_05350 [Candidatus Adiutrix sp.]|jgi:hypothetical protein|nr:hypothetical protein [Candidatus Adiutrix sp.]